MNSVCRDDGIVNILKKLMYKIT